jgi:hypothetical protein
MTTTANGVNQAEIFRRVLDQRAGALTPEVAQFFLELELPAQDRALLEQLATRARAGTLTSAEQADLDEFRRLGRLVELMKLKARKVLVSEA